MLKMLIHKRPEPKARPRATKRGVMYTPKKTKLFEDMIRFHTEANMEGSEPMQGSLEVRLVLSFKYSASWPQKRKIPQPHIMRPDLDNLVKSITDGMNGIAYQDDCQISKLVCEKVFGEEDFISVEVIPYE